MSVHHLRHLFATHLLQSGPDIRTVQELLRHSDVGTTMVYTQVLKVAAGGTTSSPKSLLPTPLACLMFHANDRLRPARRKMSNSALSSKAVGLVRRLSDRYGPKADVPKSGKQTLAWVLMSISQPAQAKSKSMPCKNNHL